MIPLRFVRTVVHPIALLCRRPESTSPRQHPDSVNLYKGWYNTHPPLSHPLPSVWRRRRASSIRSATPGTPHGTPLGPARHRRLRCPMTETRFWLIRHALVDENARAILYGVMDVALCETTLLEQGPMYRSLAQRLPREADWIVTPLTRTRRTAEAIFAAGYPRAELTEEPGLIEQSLGDWQGLPHAELPARLTLPTHAVLAAGRPGAPAGRREHGRGHRPRRRHAGTASGDA